MAESLFDPSIYDQAPSPEAQKFQLLEALELTVGKPDKAYRFVEIKLKPDTTIFERHWHEMDPSKNPPFTTSYDRYDEELQNRVHWQKCSWASQLEYTGFLQGAFIMSDDDKTTVLHIEANCTDVTASSVAIRIEDIAELGVQSEDAADVMAATQNAAVDGDTYNYQLFKGYPLEPCLTYDEILPFVTTHWPEPTTVFTAE